MSDLAPGLKRCRVCGEIKPCEEFYRWRWVCRTCYSRRTIERNRACPERRRQILHDSWQRRHANPKKRADMQLQSRLSHLRNGRKRERAKENT